MLRIGCCGFTRAQSEYARCLSLVEVQTTFYKPPRVETAVRWREAAPADFQFTLKAWQLITHEPSSPTYRRSGVHIPEGARDRYGSFRPTPEVEEAWQRTLEIAHALQARLILFQCPASLPPDEMHVAWLREFFRRHIQPDLTFAWEPRGCWPTVLIRELCSELELIHAVDPFQGLPVTAGTAYFRLHGRSGYRYRYSDEDLRQLLSWCQEYPTAYVLFNNVSMWEDALRFQAMVRTVEPPVNTEKADNWPLF